MSRLPSLKRCVDQALHGTNYYHQLGLNHHADRFDVDYAGELVLSRLESAKEDPAFNPQDVARAIQLTDKAYDVLINPQTKKEYDEFLSRQQSGLSFHDLLSYQDPFNDGDIVISKDIITYEGPLFDHDCDMGLSELIQDTTSHNTEGLDENTSELDVDLPEEKLHKDDVLAKARELFQLHNWEYAVNELNKLAARAISAEWVTSEDFLGDSQLITILQDVAVEIWASEDTDDALELYGEYLQTLEDTQLVNIDSINQSHDIKRLVYAQAKSIWKDLGFHAGPARYTHFLEECLEYGVVGRDELGKECYLPALGMAKRLWQHSEFSYAPQVYATFLERCIECGVADKYAWGKECNALALAKVKEMWNTSRLEVAPELYADFLARCITCEVAERSQFNRECYQVAAQHIKDIANHYPKELKLETYERFMRGCSASGVLTNELVIQDPVLLPYLKKILS